LCSEGFDSVGVSTDVLAWAGSELRGVAIVGAPIRLVSAGRVGVSAGARLRLGLRCTAEHRIGLPRVALLWARALLPRLPFAVEVTQWTCLVDREWVLPVCFFAAWAFPDVAALADVANP
jgi:hypothetical protein